MLKIGEFARLSQVSMKTLRHYDTLGLLRPSQIDPENGYRLYQIEQLADMMRIQALKDCGFALEEIAPLLKTYDVKAIEALLHLRVAAQQKVAAHALAHPPSIGIIGIGDGGCVWQRHPHQPVDRVVAVGRAQRRRDRQQLVGIRVQLIKS